MELKKYKLSEVATFEISNVDKKTKAGELSVHLCNFTDVYYNWAVTEAMEDSFMVATASDNQIKKLSLRKGQVAITKDSETRHDIGIPTYIANDFDNTVLGYHCALITPNPEMLDGRYLNAYLNSSLAKEYFANNASGSGMRYSLPVDAIKNILLYLPSIEVQREIGKIFSDIDRKIALNREINRNLEAMARQLYDYWFVQFDFPDENGKPYKSSGGKMVWNDKLKQEVPEYWTVSTIGKLASLNKSSLSKKEKLDELIYLDTSSLTENKIDTLQRLKREDAPNRAQRKVKKNTILYSTVRPRLKHYGIICSPPETLIASTGFCTIDANSLKYSFWLYLFLTEEKITNKLGDIADTAVSSYPSIGPSDIEGLQVCFGDDGLMNAFHEKVASLFEIMESNKNEIKALQKQRDELLPLLMNGQVSVMPPAEVNCDLVA